MDALDIFSIVIVTMVLLASLAFISFITWEFLERINKDHGVRKMLVAFAVLVVVVWAFSRVYFMVCG